MIDDHYGALLLLEERVRGFRAYLEEVQKEAANGLTNAGANELTVSLKAAADTMLAQFERTVGRLVGRER